jgi:phytoene dehydrogenase-like protein
MTTITAIPTPERGGLAGRPGPALPGVPGAYLAGDWVGPEGLLLDAALASAAAAARAALAAPRRTLAAA